MASITFVSFERHYYDRHQFYYLSAYLKHKGFKVSYVSEARFDRALDRIKALKPDFLGYSAFSNNAGVYIDFDRYQKGILGIKSVIGGPGPVFEPDFFSGATIDAVCIGEGEEALVQYLQSGGKAANNMIIGSTTAAVGYNRLIELDSLPFPDREIVYDEEPYLKKMKYRMFLSGRGCPFQCTYCHNNVFNERFKDCGKVVRKKPVDYFIGEIREVAARYNPRLIVMQDDTFIIDRQWFFEFCEKYARHINKPFACNIRANLVDEEIVKSLKNAGCACCVWSIESGNDNIRNTVLKRNMTKEHILNTADLLNRYGIKHRIGNVIGIPQETYDNVKETIEMNIRCKPHLGIANTLVPYPNLEITDYAVRSGYLDPKRLTDLPEVFWSLSILNFSRADKIRLLKTTYLFPIFVAMPVLYRNAALKNMLYALPLLMLKYMHALTDTYKMATLYPFGATIEDAFEIGKRYLKYSVARKKPVQSLNQGRA